MALATAWNQSVWIRSSGSAIEERKRKTKKTGKRPWTASPEPVRRAAKRPIDAEGDGDRDREQRRSTSDAADPGGEFGAGGEADDQVGDRLQQAEQDGAGEQAAEQGRAAQRGQRQAVEEAGLDVAGEVGAGVHHREQRPLHEGTASAKVR